jgi:hypothetical protein
VVTRRHQLRSVVYTTSHTYFATGYCDLLGTFSNIIGMDQRSREGLVACIGQMINEKFGGTVVLDDSYSVW